MDRAPSTLRVLLVEDDEHDVLAFERAFKNSEIACDITRCLRAEDAIERLRSDASSFDIVVTDYRLPGMSGLELFEAIRKAGIDLPLVITAGSGSEHTAVEALRAGVDDYIIKDPGTCYLDFLPVVLPEVVRKHADRVACGRAEEALRVSEGLYRTLVTAIPDGVVMTDPQGRITYVSPQMVGLLGYDEPEELIGRAGVELVAPEQREKAAASIQKVLVTAPSDTAEYSLLRKAGGRFPAEVRAALIRDAKGELQGFVTVARDVTDRKRVEGALQRKVAELHAFINNIPDMAWLKDRDSNFIAANKTFGDAVGMDPEYLVNHTCAVCFGQEAAAKFKEDDRRVMESGQQTRIEEGISDARGNTVHLETIKSPLFDGTGKTVGTVGVARDITERKRIEEKLRAREAELERSNAELERFAYVASHDLQEPLRMVTSFLGFVERRYGNDLNAEAREFIGYAVDGATRMKTMVNDLLAYSRAGTHGKPFRAVECETVLDRVLANLALANEESGAVITHDPLPTVTGDDAQLAQVFQNLIGNAVKFRGREPSRIHVAAEPRGSDVRFYVRDNGMGVDPLYFYRIFTVFQRLHGRDEYPGTGIGLALCKRIVERHGGTIGIESEPGKGTTFHFTIPSVGGKHQ